MLDLPEFTLRELVEAGVHYGHKTTRWNPKMEQYIFGVRDKSHIIDLRKTVPMFREALKVIYDTVKSNGRLLFVGTKPQASAVVAEAAKRCGQYYVNHRWLGGMLTNFGTVSKSIKTMVDLEKILDPENTSAKIASYTKKEMLELSRKKDKIERSLGGIRNMGGKPDLLFVIDTNKEEVAIKEAVRLGIPVVAILDSNSDPTHISYPIPGNDDASRSIKLYCQLVSDAALAGIKSAMLTSGVNIGAQEKVFSEKDEQIFEEQKSSNQLEIGDED
jgi:small subunit ribosomal protein S2